MLTVRAEQLHQLAVPLEASFLDDLAVMVRNAFPAASGPDEAALREGVGNALRQADAWGLTTEQSAAFAVWLLYRLGPGLRGDECADLRRVLEADDLAPSEKVHLATRWLAARGID